MIHKILRMRKVSLYVFITINCRGCELFSIHDKIVVKILLPIIHLFITIVSLLSLEGEALNFNKLNCCYSYPLL